jgi:hypothetical protein
VFVRRLSAVLLLSLVLNACGGEAASPEVDTGTTTTSPLTSTEDGDQNSVDTAATTTTTEPDGPLLAADLLGEPLNKYALESDDCFAQVDDLDQGRPVTRTTRLDCSDPHEFQVFHRLSYPAIHPSIFPGDNVVRQFAIESCYREFEAWVGHEYETSILDLDVFIPTQLNFEDSNARYRGIHCIVDRVDGEPMIGTARGSGW